MALGVKDVIGLIITYIGTKTLGAVPLKPTIGVNIQGTPAMAVDLFAVLGGLFPNLSLVVGEFLSSTFNELAVNLGLDPKNLFMSSPLGTLTTDIGNALDNFVVDLKLGAGQLANELSSSIEATNFAMASYKSAVDQLAGLPSTAWSEFATTEFSLAAQSLSPASLVSNIPGTLANSVAIDSAISGFSSNIFVQAAQADISILRSRISTAVTDTAKDLLAKELKTTLNDLTGQLNGKMSAFAAQAAEIGKNLNPMENMSIQIVPPSINIKGGAAIMAELEKLKAQYTPEQLNAAAAMVARWDSAVNPIFKTNVLPTVDEALAMEANTSITATDRLAAASTDIEYNNGYPNGVNVRYDSA
jgi:hypothetical protein